MSWSGPLAGAAPFPTPPYANSYAQHQPYQHGQQPPHHQYQQGAPYPGPPQPTHDSRPPKKKGNPIITRYPPPPGYRGPAQPRGPFNVPQHHTQYQAPPPQPGFSQVGPTQPNYPSQGYATVPPQQVYTSQTHGLPQPPSFPPSNPPGQHYHWPQQAYQTSQAAPQSSSYSGNQTYPAQTSYLAYPAHATVGNPRQQGYNPTARWPQAQTKPTYPMQKANNGHEGSVTSNQSMIDANATPTPATAHLASAPSASGHSPNDVSRDSTTAHKPELYLAWDDWDFDFDGAIWPKSNEPVDPNLSLGVIIWHPAKQATRALPATFEEAEEQSLKPTPERLGNGESVSIYFTAENSHEAFLDVRQTDEWEYINGDPVFVVFTDEDINHNLVPIEDCITQRDRPDVLLEPDTNTEDAEMHEADWSVMDNLEQALSADGRESVFEKPQTQEEILASLGVTGLPKPVIEGPMAPHITTHEARSVASPLDGPGQHSQPLHSKPMPNAHHELMVPSRVPPPRLEPQRSQSLSGNRQVDVPSTPQRSYGSMSASANSQPPPPTLQEHDRFDPWNPSHRRQQYNNNGFNGGRGSPARSEASNGTAAGSDFGTDQAAKTQDLSLTPGSKFERSDSSVSRKRSHGDTADDERLREHDDHSKRKRRSIVDAAYSRR